MTSLSMRLVGDVSSYGKLLNDLMRRSKSEFTTKQTIEDAMGGYSETDGNRAFIGAHWKDPELFKIVERERRDKHVEASTGSKLFISHCWRNPDYQQKKRRIAAHISAPPEDGGLGLVYWADWLDLQANGPVPWRQEIEQAIANCSKFIAMIDRAWLTSYNCLQELALALHYNKPVIAMVLEQEAWDLLTVPGGAEKAKAAADDIQRSGRYKLDYDQNNTTTPVASSSQRHARRFIEAHAAQAWASDAHSPSPLMHYHMEEIIPGEPLSLRVLVGLFARLSSINLCCCRTDDTGQRGPWLRNVTSFVKKDLGYAKEHAELRSLAARWVNTDRPQRLLLPREEAMWWAKWIKNWSAGGSPEPAPDPQQREYVDASMACAKRKRTAAWSIAGVTLMLILSIAVLACVWASDARRAERRAHEEAKRAMAAEDVAMQEADNARAAVALATEEAKRARLAEDAALLRGIEAVGMSALSLVSYTDAVPGVRDLKVVNAVLNQLTGRGSEMVDEHALAAARGILASDIRPYSSFHTAESTLIGAKWSKQASLLAAGGLESHVRVWVISDDGSIAGDPNSPAAQIPIEGEGLRVGALEWSPDGRLLATSALAMQGWPPVMVSGSGDISIWKIHRTSPANGSVAVEQTHQVLKGHRSAVIALAWSPGGEYLASGSMDSDIWLWPLTTSTGEIDSTRAFILDAHATLVSALAWSPSGDYLASGSSMSDASIFLWKVEDGGGSNSSVAVSAPRRLGSSTSGVGALTWSPTSAFLASSDMMDGSAIVWRVADDEGVHVPPQQISGIGAKGSLQHFLEWSPTGRHLASATGSIVRVWPVAPDGSIDEDGVSILSGHTTTLWALAWSPTGDYLLTSSSDLPIHLWAICPDSFASAHRRVWMINHTPLINTVAWNPVDTNVFAAGNGEGSVAVWNRNGSFVSVLSTAGSNVRSLAWSPDGRFLAVGNIVVFEYDLTAGILLADSRRQVGDLQQYGSVHALAWSPGGSLLASGGSDTNIALWTTLPSDNGDEASVYPNAADLRQHSTLLGHVQQVTSLAWAPSDSLLASGGADGVVRLWNVSTLIWGSFSNTSVSLRGHEGWVRCLAWSGNQLASAGDDRTIRIWQIPSGTIDQTTHIQSRLIYEAHMSWVMSVAWSPDGRMLASGSRDGRIAVWRTAEQLIDGKDVDPPQMLQVLEGHKDWVRSVAWAPMRSTSDQLSLLSGGWDNTVRLWAVDKEGGDGGATGESIISAAPLVMTDPYHARAYVVNGPKAEEALLSNRDTLPVGLWSVKRSPLCAATKIPQLLDGHVTVWVSSVAWAPGGAHLASAGPDNGIQLWKVASNGTILGSSTQLLPKRPGLGAQPLAWSPSSLHLASSGGGRDANIIRLWAVLPDGNVATTPVVSLDSHATEILALTWAPTAYVLASGAADGTVHVWSLTRARDCALLGVQVIQASASGVNALAWAPAGNVLVAGDNHGDLIMWTLPQPQHSEGAERVVDVDSMRVISGHDGPVSTLSWSAGGSLLASGSSDSTVRLWEARGEGGVNTDAVAVLSSSSAGQVTSVAWSPDGCELATAATDGTIRLWRHWDSKTHCRDTGDDGGSFNMHVVQVLRSTSDTWVNSLAWDPLGGRLVSASNEPPLSVWTVGFEPICQAFNHAFTSRLNLELTSSDYASHAFLEGLSAFGEDSAIEQTTRPATPPTDHEGFETPAADR